jgi:hypothetical protein
MSGHALANLAYLFAGMALAYVDVYEGPPAFDPRTVAMGLALGCACMSAAIRRPKP